MGDTIRKRASWHLPATLGVAMALVLGASGAHAKGKTSSCLIQGGTLGETDQSTREISTEELEGLMNQRGAVLIDARPYEEYAMSHIPGAVNLSPKPGLPMSEYTSDVAELGKLLGVKRSSLLVVYCNGPYCGKSKRFAADLLKAGYTNVIRYQLGIPVWRALGHPAQARPEGIWTALDKDRTAVFIDARDPAAFAAGTFPGARNVRADEVTRAKDDGRLPMLDHNTRIFVVGSDAHEASVAAEAIAHNAFQNVSYYAGPIATLMQTRPGSESH